MDVGEAEKAREEARELQRMLDEVRGFSQQPESRISLPQP